MKQLMVPFIILLLMVPLIPAAADPTPTPAFISGNELIYNPPPDWGVFWSKFNQYSDWDLEYYDGSQWISEKNDLQVVRDYPEPNHIKLTLIFDASHAANYRLTFAINKVVRQYVTRISQYQYELTYENFTMIWDWSDAVAIPGLVFTHGVLNDVFWFRMRRDNVPLGAHVEIDPSLIASYPETNQDNEYTLKDEHPSDGARNSAAGQAFLLTTYPVKVSSAKFYLKKTGLPTDYAYVNIYETTGTYGSSAKPTGAPIAYSVRYNVADLTTGYQLITFTFNATNQPTLQPNTVYCIAFTAPSTGGIDDANYIHVGCDASAPSHPGNGFYYQNGAWTTPAYDMIFYVYGDPVYGAGSYLFHFNDALYENNTDAGSVTVTAHLPGGTENFTVDGDDWWGNTELPIAFSWSLGATTRYVYVAEEENFTVTLPDDTAYIYGFIVKDYTGKTGEGQAYLEAWRTIGGVDTLVERMPLQQPNPVPMNLVYGKVYRMRVLFNDTTRFDWGYFVAGGTSSITIILRTVEFTDQAQVLYNHITVEATRDATGTIITVDYEDTRTNTIWANVTIRIRNGAVVLNAPRNNDTYTVNWNGANAALGYVVTVEGEHTDYGEWGYSKILDQDEAFPPAPDVTGIIDLGVGPNFGPWLLVMGSVIGFSVRFQARGVLAGAAMVSLLSYIGWASWSWEVNVFAWFLAVVVTLIGGRE